MAVRTSGEAQRKNEKREERRGDGCEKRLVAMGRMERRGEGGTLVQCARQERSNQLGDVKCVSRRF